jgi:hypothetical protein
MLVPTDFHEFQPPVFAMEKPATGALAGLSRTTSYIPGSVDDSHATAADLLDYPVARYLPTSRKIGTDLGVGKGHLCPSASELRCWLATGQFHWRDIVTVGHNTTESITNYVPG